MVKIRSLQLLYSFNLFIWIDNGKYITAINKKNHIDIKCSLLNKTLHFVTTGIFSIKLLRQLTKLYPMTKISPDHKN